MTVAIHEHSRTKPDTLFRKASVVAEKNVTYFAYLSIDGAHSRTLDHDEEIRVFIPVAGRIEEVRLKVDADLKKNVSNIVSHDEESDPRVDYRKWGMNPQFAYEHVPTYQD